MSGEVLNPPEKKEEDPISIEQAMHEGRANNDGIEQDLDELFISPHFNNPIDEILRKSGISIH